MQQEEENAAVTLQRSLALSQLNRIRFPKSMNVLGERKKDLSNNDTKNNEYK